MSNNAIEPITRTPEAPPLEPRTRTPEASSHFEFENTVKVKKKHPAKTLQQDFLTDVLYFICVIVIGLIVGNIPWITVSAHLVCSLTCMVIATFPLKDDNINTTVLVGLTTVTALFDFFCIFQSVCKRLDASDEIPTAFAYGINVLNLFNLFFVVSTHFISFGNAINRAYRCGVHFDTNAIFSTIGISLAAVIIYTLWLIDLGSSSGSWIRPHFFFTLVLLSVMVFDSIIAFKWVAFSTRHAWWCLSVTLFFVYVTLVINVSQLFEETITLGSFMDTVTTHQYKGTCDKLQCITLLCIISLSIANRLIHTCPKKKHCVNKHICVHTPASINSVEPFASLCTTLCTFALSTLPFICSIVGLFADYTPVVSRFLLLMYGSFLTLRFWILKMTVQVWLFVTTAIIGIVVDILIGLDVVLNDNGTILRKRGQFETTTILVVAVVSMTTSVVCLIHSLSQHIKLKRREKMA